MRNLIRLTAALTLGLAAISPLRAETLATYEVTATTVKQQLPLEGVVEATNRAVVSAQTAGRILEMPYEIGDEVVAGSMIVSITNTEQRAGYDAALAQLAAAKAQAAEVATQYQRIAELFDKKMVSKTDYDRSKASRDSSDAAVKAAEAGLRRAKQTLAYTEVYAPYSGIVVNRLVEIGESVAPGTPLLEGLALDAMRVRVDLPQSAAEALSANNDAAVELDNGDVLTPTKIRLSPKANPISHTFSSLMDLPYGQRVLPGSLVKVLVTVDERDTLQIPNSAIVERGDIEAAYVVSEQGIEMRYVRLGRQLGDFTEVLAGLVAGEHVAIDTLAATLAIRNKQ